LGGTPIDVIVHPDNRWELQEYKNESGATRTAKSAAAAGGLPDAAVLQMLAPQPYNLQRHPIGSEPANPADTKSNFI